MELAMICTKYPKSVQHTYLVDVCDESKDRYRFGFNGQEKDNELKGIGNSLEFKYRIYDSRLGRFLSKNPLHSKYPWNSSYAFAENDVIRAVDLEGLEKVIVTTNGETSNESIYYREMKLNKRQSEWGKGKYGYVDPKTSQMTITNEAQTERDQRWHDELVDPNNIAIFKAQWAGSAD